MPAISFLKQVVGLILIYHNYGRNKDRIRSDA